ncbi:hypothetical protein NQ318_019706 [Aromia moschata]|uniref:Uncharacterized protein n=1 Tax=Aromia moschata TaxID=1265417 RepID=A0AAV8Z5Z7_9CUCU|nr:hypothetical protein NQ318_019706 [Aromia moschata]
MSSMVVFDYNTVQPPLRRCVGNRKYRKKRRKWSTKERIHKSGSAAPPGTVDPLGQLAWGSFTCPKLDPFEEDDWLRRQTRTQAEVVRLFQEKYPELPPISQGTVSKIEKQFRERIIGENIIGPFFIDDNLNGETYLALLQNNVVPTMANLYPAEGNPQLPGNAIWFQQDGAPAHYKVNVDR